LHAKAKAEPGFRFYALYDKISREDILMHAYAQCRSNKGAPGVDGQDFADIEAYGVQRWLGELALALREESYRPDPIRRVFIPKANGKLRPLGISTLRDRVGMTAAMLVLEPIFEADLPPEQYAYRPGRNAQQAVIEVAETVYYGHPEVVDADLADDRQGPAGHAAVEEEHPAHGREAPRDDRSLDDVARDHANGGQIESHLARLGELLPSGDRPPRLPCARQLHGDAVASVVAPQVQGQAKQGRDLSTLEPLRAFRSRADRGRITARVPQNVQDTLEQAADLLGATLNQFVVQAALTEAQRVIERERVIHLSSNDAAFLLNLLEAPPVPNARLRKAVQNYKSRTLDAEHSTFEWTPQPKPVPKRKR
jgi:uncharacterized protein (DUF1778 family)